MLICSKTSLILFSVAHFFAPSKPFIANSSSGSSKYFIYSGEDLPLNESDFLTEEEKVLAEKEKEKEKLDRIIKVAKERVEKYFVTKIYFTFRLYYLFTNNIIKFFLHGFIVIFHIFQCLFIYAYLL
jgi:hypothetical protein